MIDSTRLNRKFDITQVNNALLIETNLCNNNQVEPVYAHKTASWYYDLEEVKDIFLNTEDNVVPDHNFNFFDVQFV